MGGHIEQTSELRNATAIAHQMCIERVIRNVRDNPAHTFSLTEMAGIACMSPHHFNRVFRTITGLPPRVFQCLLRMEAAKRMLMMTELTITDVCFETGYSSLGTFTRRFAEIVGVPPSRFRRLLDKPHWGTAPARCPGSGASIVGLVRVPANFTGRVFVGAFPDPIPHGRPAGCSILSTPVDSFRLDEIPSGSYYVAGVGIAQLSGTPEGLLHENVLRARFGPINARCGTVVLEQPLILRPAEMTDAPILIPFWTVFDAAIVGRDESVELESSNLGEVRRPVLAAKLGHVDFARSEDRRSRHVNVVEPRR
jgi:AraC family transcriptional regulator